jgi:predicted nucleotidyltransferase
MDNLSDNERVALAKLKEALSRDFRLVELRLFGSKARGDSHRESDMDVLIVLEDYDWETEKAIYDLCYDISVDHSVVIAPSLYSRAEFDSPLERATLFSQAVELEGVPLVGHSTCG